VGKTKYAIFIAKLVILTLLLQLSAVVSGLNIAILLGLLVIYARSFHRIKSGFTVGLVLFALFLIIHNGLGVFSYIFMDGYFDVSIAPFMFSLSSAELVGLSILLGTTLR